MLRAFLITALLLAADATAAERCNWKAIALPRHQAMVEAEVTPLLTRIPTQSDDPEYISGAGLARTLLAQARKPQPLGRIEGDWRVCSIQVHADFAYAYPTFKARIDKAACGYRFAKISGSQRRSGFLWPIAGDVRQLAFLGANTVNDDPPLDYDPRRPSIDGFEHTNSAGRLLRTGPNELLLILDADGSRFELYQLTR
ncbi:DUF4893 domain-containing protein [Lysobacter sp. CFH 32150]|uniref:DUF4893 domain-containing protein n=1 Tax=Lysobacter sp. CFH 32150 TaxID=2927128 RepID=UPI001FA7CA1A|nr:DUF4893 domain-containing protein [Lysobacter sp. CFH 32150]MCI4568652.1 DUF4893 domain-containing protein [Lysobacter sp. CFH 32150]